MTNIIPIDEYYNRYLKLDVDRVTLQLEIEGMQKQLSETELAKAIKVKKELLYQMEEKEKLMKEEIKNQMLDNGVLELETSGYKLKIKTSPGALQVQDEKLIPRKYFKEVIDYTIDRNLIKKQLKAGIILPGCSIEKTKSLVIEKI